jgi:hypothetical protein
MNLYPIEYIELLPIVFDAIIDIHLNKNKNKKIKIDLINVMSNFFYLYSFFSIYG